MKADNLIVGGKGYSRRLTRRLTTEDAAAEILWAYGVQNAMVIDDGGPQLVCDTKNGPGGPWGLTSETAAFVRGVLWLHEMLQRGASPR